jgi:hypothetical protein
MEQSSNADYQPQTVSIFHDEHEAFASTRSSQFVYVPSNEVLFEALDTHADTVEHDVRLPMVVAGDEGSGKSALLANWVLSRRETKHKNEFLFHYYAECSEGARDLANMLRCLESAIKQFFQLREMEVPDTEERLSWALNRFLHAAVKKTDQPKLVIVIDGVNLLTSTRELEGSLHWLPIELPPCVRFIVSTLERIPNMSSSGGSQASDSQQQKQTSPSDKIPYDELPLSRCYTELTRRGYHKILMEHLSVHVRTLIMQEFLTKSKISDPLFGIEDSNQFRVVTSFSSVSPLYLRCFLCMLRLYSQISGFHSDTQVETFLHCESPRAVVDKALTMCYRVIWDRVSAQSHAEESHEKMTIARSKAEVLMSILSMLYASRDGLSEMEIWDLVRMNTNVEIDDSLKSIILNIVVCLCLCISCIIIIYMRIFINIILIFYYFILCSMLLLYVLMVNTLFLMEYIRMLCIENISQLPHLCCIGIKPWAIILQNCLYVIANLFVCHIT